MAVLSHPITGAAGRLRDLPLIPLLALDAARGQLLPLAAVLFASGAGIWFALPWEPGRAFYLVILGLALACGFLWRLGPDLGRPLAAGAFALLAGVLAAGIRAEMQAAPMLSFRYYGPIEGRIVEIDRSGSDAVRLTLDRVVLREMDPDRTPLRVRISLQGGQSFLDPAPGQLVILTGHLSPPDTAAEPGGFDFRRMAWFDRLGGVGYTLKPVLLLEPPGPAEAWIGRLRVTLSAAIRAQIPGQAGAFAAGAMTGDRSAITQDTVEALRDSSLAHILAISGMNMAFLAAFVFALIRGGIALVPPVALRVNAKKVSAVLSFFVALFYLMLSGANVATERAFLMITVMLGAILLDRRAMSLRSVAISALILLALRPESLLEPGFQMSFAATIGLISGFRALDRAVALAEWPRWTVPVFTLVASSLIGGFATAPFAAAHFNRFADYGLIANLLTVPAMGILIMPMGVIAFLLAPLGLSALPLWLMGLGAEWTLIVAHRVAAMEGAVTAIPAPPVWALPVLSLGAMWLVLWPGRARLAGLVPVLVTLALWTQAPRPAGLISGDGRLAGVMGAEGRALSSGRGGGFAARNWLENDGDLAAQTKAATRPGFDGPAHARAFRIGGLKGVVLSGKAGLAELPAACAAADFVVLSVKPEAPPAGCHVIGPDLLGQTGALSLWPRPDGQVLVMTARAGGRLWTGRPMNRAVVVAALPPGMILAPGQ